MMKHQSIVVQLRSVPCEVFTELVHVLEYLIWKKYKGMFMPILIPIIIVINYFSENIIVLAMIW